MTKEQRIIAKLKNAIPDVKELGSGVVRWDKLTFKLTLTGFEITEIIKALKSEQEEDRDIHTYFYKRILEILKSNFYPLGEADDDAQCAEMITQFVLDEKRN